MKCCSCGEDTARFGRKQFCDSCKTKALLAFTTKLIKGEAVPSHKPKTRWFANELKSDPEKLRETGKTYRKYHNLKKYGLSLEKWDEMFRDQKGVCAICQTVEASGKNLSVDHCHTTGKVRGLLCVRCNNGIGCFLDNPELLQAAIDYLL